VRADFGTLLDDADTQFLAGFCAFCLSRHAAASRTGRRRMMTSYRITTARDVHRSMRTSSSSAPAVPGLRPRAGSSRRRQKPARNWVSASSRRVPKSARTSFGAVFEPRSLKNSPDYKEKGAPIGVPVSRDDVYFFLSATSAIKMPTCSYRRRCTTTATNPLARNLCRWLGKQAEALGVEIYPGFARRTRSSRTTSSRASSSATWRDREGKHKEGFTAGHGAAREVHVLREGGARPPREKTAQALRARQGTPIRSTGPSASRKSGRAARSMSRGCRARRGLAARPTPIPADRSCITREQPDPRRADRRPVDSNPSCRRSTSSSASRRIRKSARTLKGQARLVRRARDLQGRLNSCRR